MLGKDVRWLIFYIKKTAHSKKYSCNLTDLQRYG
uniref:Uncharacterized protein n=1 Tax=Podoviridae sp. ct7K12 TaxID=2826540 RepID=A0A8S5N7M3_9CAUD|nr:MAG TPA: hypothetical protein [Podoviridae sp. ct7K12]